MELLQISSLEAWHRGCLDALFDERSAHDQAFGDDWFAGF